mgnify:CR=1 FL=1
MRHLLLLLTVFICACSSHVEVGKRMMFYKDTDRKGVPFSKDPFIAHFGGRYLMYYSIPPYENATNKGWNIGIAESHNLVDWKKVGEMTPDKDAPYEERGFCAPGGIVRNDTLHLFYQIYGNGRKDAICHAYSTDGINFTRDASNPIFSPEGDWTCGRAIDAEVCFYKNKYYLYFATRDADFKIQMQGVATAPEGCNFSRSCWTQACSSSILKPTLPWEGECVEGATITQKNGKLYMFYAGAYNNAPQQIGVAVSSDGINWQRLSDEPFLRNGKPGSWNESESGHPCIFTDNDGKTYLFFQGNNTKGKTWILSCKEVFWKKGKPYLRW